MHAEFTTPLKASCPSWHDNLLSAILMCNVPLPFRFCAKCFACSGMTLGHVSKTTEQASVNWWTVTATLNWHSSKVWVENKTAVPRISQICQQKIHIPRKIQRNCLKHTNLSNLTENKKSFTKQEVLPGKLHKPGKSCCFFNLLYLPTTHTNAFFVLFLNCLGFQGLCSLSHLHGIFSCLS